MRPTEIDPTQYDQLLNEKAEQIQQQFSGLIDTQLEIFRSEPLHYRQRAEFRVWHEGDDLYHIMFDQQSKSKYRVDHFPPGSRLINQLMQDLLELLKPNPIARQKLFQIDYLTSLSGQAVISLLYHKQLDDEWLSEIGNIRAKLREKYDVQIIGRARKQKHILDSDYVIESLPINGRNYDFKQIENSFTQPNANVNCQMIEWALDCTSDSKSDLLELYCGAGNFTLPLAQNFNRVLATEISKSSVNAAQFNIARNNIENVDIIRMSSEEFTQAINKQRTFSRLDGIDLDSYRCNTIFVDPPRAGLDDNTLELVSGYDNILYISCNPDTLFNNLQTLTQTHQVSRFALFDQFPYTHHAECGVWLTKA
ncbi:tRNA (uridine(54)-C5)-methyltransferase TrmA [Neptunicella marina]|uniref:tRNA/tmRNA (uracil-C(5))-methyltransferase n=1 Tax=Neptunicella marina TaxID=2125989 RepID=A0A8J6IWV9_9ALTE|nr:tRNA (uridine(54)-C5)-methyltransferase TrmA [Neptunicella marina]